MTPEERAEEIMRVRRWHFLDNGDELVGEIVSQIREAEKEARVDAMQDWFMKANEEMNKHQYELGRSSMREEAANLVETEHKVCLPLMCETAKKVRAIGVGKCS